MQFTREGNRVAIKNKTYRNSTTKSGKGSMNSNWSSRAREGMARAVLRVAGGTISCGWALHRLARFICPWIGEDEIRSDSDPVDVAMYGLDRPLTPEEGCRLNG